MSLEMKNLRDFLIVSFKATLDDPEQPLSKNTKTRTEELIEQFKTMSDDEIKTYWEKNCLPKCEHGQDKNECLKKDEDEDYCGYYDDVERFGTDGIPDY